jgi:hypothetical protein
MLELHSGEKSVMALFGNHILAAFTVAERDEDRHSSSIVPAALMCVMPYQYNQRAVKRWRDVQTPVWDSHEGVNPITPFDLPLVVDFFSVHALRVVSPRAKG